MDTSEASAGGLRPGGEAPGGQG
ncbi:hypothetical protein STREPTOSP366_53940, partial [Streptomyces variabilis]